MVRFLPWLAAAAALAQQPFSPAANDPIQDGRNLQAAVQINDAIWMAVGFGNTYLIKTSEGSVIIDTSFAPQAPQHRKLLEAAQPGTVRYIILTHGHADHVGGVALWKQPGTRIITSKQFIEFRQYQARIAGFLSLRGAAQLGLPRSLDAGRQTPVVPDITFEKDYRFELGGVQFDIHHTPGETPDHLSVWIPRWKAAFPGDNIYDSFPNLYTLRGTTPRWPLEYVASLEKVSGWRPELLLPSHGRAIQGADLVERRISKYIAAIRYVHDATVKGMNDGKDVFTLMKEIRLPSDLDIGEGYGNLPWSVRGIYEGYAGWFDGNPASMYPVSPRDVYPEVAQLAGGATKLAERARVLMDQGKTVEALHLADIAIAAEAGNKQAWQVRLDSFRKLLKDSRNSNERGWLNHGIREAQQRLDAK